MKKHVLSLLAAFTVCLCSHSLHAEALHEAARKGDLQQIKAAFDNGENINGFDKGGATALIRAVGHPKAVVFLVLNGADVNKQDKNGSTALFWAATKKQAGIEVVPFLLSHGADPELKNKFGQTPVFAANSKAVMEILANKGLDIDLVDNLKTTPLSRQANDLNNTALLEFLIAKGADVNGKGEQVPLIQAAMGGRSENVALLLNHGADVKTTDRYGKTALHYPYTLSIVRSLVAKGAEVNAVEKNGNTPLHNAPSGEIAKLLLEYGADKQAKNKVGQTPLDIALDKLEKAKENKEKEMISRYESLVRILK